MFKKLLIANRGEIAVRIAHACRDLGITAVVLYEAPDRNSLHVRLADECLPLRSPLGFMDQDEILRLACSCGADALHPGYGFLAEEAGLIDACAAAGIAFVGPPAAAVRALRDKPGALLRARAAGFATPDCSQACFGPDDGAALAAEAERIGYPLLVKSCRGGRGRGECLVRRPERLAAAARRALTEALAVYGDERVFLERALLPAHLIRVQTLGDAHGRLIHLGERDGSLQYGNQNIIDETPSPALAPEQRTRLWQDALAIACLFGCQSACTVEFVVDEHGRAYFSEIKARIQMEHPITELAAQIDLVREQIRCAAGEPLELCQEDVALHGHALQCRIYAEDPWNGDLPSPGHITHVRLPSGPHVRVDTYVADGVDVPARYDTLVAKIIVWGADRDETLRRMRRALDELRLDGIPTNLPHLQRALEHPDVLAGAYDTGFFQPRHAATAPPDRPAPYLRDMAIAAAIAYAQRFQIVYQPNRAQRLARPDGGWHNAGRQLPS
jgi:acetyl-CoA carboxylase biotin carboxylase subunit